MLFGETVAVYCENHTEHINTLCGQNAETLYIRIQSVPHKKHYVSATETNQLMLFRETVAVYCENHMEHINTLWAEYRDFIYKN
jgi:translation initiation factor IF-1